MVNSGSSTFLVVQVLVGGDITETEVHPAKFKLHTSFLNFFFFLILETSMSSHFPSTLTSLTLLVYPCSRLNYFKSLEFGSHCSFLIQWKTEIYNIYKKFYPRPYSFMKGHDGGQAWLICSSQQLLSQQSRWHLLPLPHTLGRLARHSCLESLHWRGLGGRPQWIA